MLTEKEKFEQTKAVVVATDAEKNFLWLMWHNVLKFEQDNMGCVYTIGHMGKEPVVVSVFWYLIEDVRVAFVDPISFVVNYQMIEKWIASSFPSVQKFETNTFSKCLDVVAKNWCNDENKKMTYKKIYDMLLRGVK